MAKLTKSPKRINEIVAQHVDVQKTLAMHAGRIGSKAKSIHAAHIYSGDSQVYVAHGDVDWYINLDDRRGLGAALSIEYGHFRATGTDEAPGEPVWVEGIYALTTPDGRIRT